MEQLSPLGKTALYICAGRALETKNRPVSEILFNDPYAEKFSGDYGFGFLKAMAETISDSIPLETRIQLFADAVSIRTAYFDKVIMDAVSKDDVKQLVIMGVGGDCRAYRLPLPKDCTTYEIDLPDVIDYRTQILSSLGAVSPNKIVSVGCDVNNKMIWTQKLVENGFDKNIKSLFLLEGLIMYLKKEDIEGLLATISEISCEGSYITGDSLSNEYLTDSLTKKSLEVWSVWGAPVISTCSNLEELFEKFNYRCKINHYGDSDANFGRAPYHKKEDEEEGKPRNLFYICVKNKFK